MCVLGYFTRVLFRLGNTAPGHGTKHTMTAICCVRAHWACFQTPHTLEEPSSAIQIGFFLCVRHFRVG